LGAEAPRVAVNSIWVVAWFGPYDKLAMTRRLMREAFATDIDTDRDAMIYVGDSTNDAPMFAPKFGRRQQRRKPFDEPRAERSDMAQCLSRRRRLR
jgi:hypothetical protein